MGMWSGRFKEKTAEELTKFSESVSFDWRLYKFDIQGSIAHATMLGEVGILTKSERDKIIKGLREIEREIDAGEFEFDVTLEDVHMNIEAALTQRIGDAGAKLHTARSRNDQVATDMRLYVRHEIEEARRLIHALQKSLLHLAADNMEVVMPGYTHLQRAQPVFFAHHLLAYIEMLDRDYERFSDCWRRVNVLPLGSGAIAGTTLPIDRKLVAQLLDFPKVTQNSMDAVSDRDFMVEYVATAALTGVHLSRLAEDVILWCTSEFNFISIADAYTTGSSLMPQKKNPDVAELTRGKSARIIGDLTSLLVLLKGLPLTYNRDMQEDKERLFDASDTLKATLSICAKMFRNIRVNAVNMTNAAKDHALLATDLADYLVIKGMPFRQAHHAVGKAVGLAQSRNVSLGQLSLADLKQISTLFEQDALEVFDLRRAMNARQVIGAPSLKNVQQQIRRWEKVLEKAEE